MIFILIQVAASSGSQSKRMLMVLVLRFLIRDLKLASLWMIVAAL